MGTITIQIKVDQTVTTANGAALQNIMDWVQTNIISKLPANVAYTILYNVVP